MNRWELRDLLRKREKAIAMKCLDCVCCKPGEVLICEIRGCPLWSIRPKNYKYLYKYAKELKEKNPSMFVAKI